MVDSKLESQEFVPLRLKWTRCAGPDAGRAAADMTRVRFEFPPSLNFTIQVGVQESNGSIVSDLQRPGEMSAGATASRCPTVAGKTRSGTDWQAF